MYAFKKTNNPKLECLPIGIWRIYSRETKFLGKKPKKHSVCQMYGSWISRCAYCIHLNVFFPSEFYRVIVRVCVCVFRSTVQHLYTFESNNLSLRQHVPCTSTRNGSLIIKSPNLYWFYISNLSSLSNLRARLVLLYISDRFDKSDKLEMGSIQIGRFDFQRPLVNRSPCPHSIFFLNSIYTDDKPKSKACTRV